MKFIVDKGIENIVFLTLQKQHKISVPDPDYIATVLGFHLTEKEYLSLRRGVRWILTHTDLPSISDEKLREILKKHNIIVKQKER